MSPESSISLLGSRIGRIEERMAALEQRVTGAENAVGRVESTPERMATFEAYASELREDVKEIKQSMERRGTESLSSRQWTIGLAVVILLGLLGLAAQIYLAAHGST